MKTVNRLAALGALVGILLMSGCCWGRWWDGDGGGRHGHGDHEREHYRTNPLWHLDGRCAGRQTLPRESDTLAVL